MKTSHLVAAVATASVAGAATATQITLTASGTVNDSSDPGVSVGTSFSATLVYDSTASATTLPNGWSGYGALLSFTIQVGAQEIAFDLDLPGNVLGEPDIDTVVADDFSASVAFPARDILQFNARPDVPGGDTGLGFLFLSFDPSAFSGQGLPTNLDTSTLLSDQSVFQYSATAPTFPPDWTATISAVTIEGMEVIPLPPAAWMGLAGLATVSVMRRRRLTAS